MFEGPNTDLHSGQFCFDFLSSKSEAVMNSKQQHHSNFGLGASGLEIIPVVSRNSDRMWEKHNFYRGTRGLHFC